jgi:pSer/pThr/pTyr-binding forkhead associated (FHA) protein
MDVVLKAVSHPEIGDIRIKDKLCLIGRHEMPFFASGSEDVSQLSRRHARIFQQDDTTYIVDLDSSNGTVLNGGPVRSEPTPLNHGDEICFAGRLIYRVELDEATTFQGDVQGSRSIRIVLEKKHPDRRSDLLLITYFPFLVSKADPSFMRYRDAYSAALEKVSRRHAYIFVKDRNVYIEDLDSTNGTFVSGARLGKQPRALVDGDTVAFGAPDFVFKVHVQYEISNQMDPTVPGTKVCLSALGAANASGGTISVNSPTSFLEIFSASNAANLDDAEAARAAQMPPADRRPAMWTRYLIGTGTAVVAALVATLWLFESNESRVRSLLAEGRYRESAQAANELLKEDPNNVEVAVMATEALARAVVPTWMTEIERGDAKGVKSVLASARSELASHHDEGQRMLDTLAWIGDINEFRASHQGAVIPLAFFRDEAPIRDILDRWEREQSEFAHLSTVIVRLVPPYEQVYTEALSHARQLRDAQSLYIQAMEDLKRRLQDHLQHATLEEAASDLEAFKSKYPNISGVDELQADLRDHATLAQLAETKDLMGISRVRDGSAFRTPLFKAAFVEFIANKLPSVEVLAQYQRALEFWQSGSIAAAMDTLQPLADQAWGEIAQSRIAHYQSVAAAYTELEGARGVGNYSDRLLSFYRDLNPKDDTYFIRAVEPEVAKYKGKALATALELSRSAKLDWDAYIKDSGISAKIRVEKTVSETYKLQARRLSNAYSQIGKAAATYDLLKAEYPKNVSELRSVVVAEVRRQRQWIGDLKLIIAPALLGQKLQLLPAL